MRSPAPDDANLASLGRLEAVLDRLRNAGRLRINGSLWLDEYGYQTNPPDPFLGVLTDRGRTAGCRRPRTSPGATRA